MFTRRFRTGRISTLPVIFCIASLAFVLAEDDDFHQTKKVNVEVKEPTWTAEQKSHWAYQPPKMPVSPKVKQAGWVRNPIDAFVLSQDRKIRFSALA